jgi:PIN domain nuclease of toxin-antitoxin system
VRLLLDTHAYLWWLADDPQLRPAARAAIEAPQSVVHVSAASIWEIAVKAQLGRIGLRNADLTAEIDANGFVELPIRAHHAQRAGALPRHHDDPFDRMLIAQAEIERLLLVTRDRRLRAYGVELLEA